MPALTDEIKEKIRAASPILEVAGEFLTLQKQGGLYVAKCFKPHGGVPDAPIYEDSPSLTFYPDSNSYYCYGCGLGKRGEGDSGSDVFGLVQNYFRYAANEEIGFHEVAKFLVDRAQRVAAERGEPCDLHLAPPVPPDPEVERVKQQKTERNRKLYANLMNDPDARQYLHGRGLTDEDIATFRLGLTLADDPWDLARNRIAFGICELRTDGKSPATIGFSYREVPGRPHNGAKYIVDVDSKAFSRRNTLYLLHLAYREIRRRGYAHLVEGNLDAIHMHKAGKANTVCSLGVTVTDDALDLLRKYTAKLIVWLEDDAGLKAFLQGLPRYLARGFEVQVVVTGGKDPDEICMKYGAEGIDSYVIAKARPALQYFTEQVASAYNAAIHQAKVRALGHIIPMVGAIKNPVERAIIAGQVARQYDIPVDFLFPQAPPPASHTSPQRVPILASAGPARKISFKAAGE